METSKTYDSSDRELQDYIRRQKARGSQPNVALPQVTEASAYRAWTPFWPRVPAQEQRMSYQRPRFHKSTYRMLKAVQIQQPPLPKMHCTSGPRPGPTHHYQKNQACLSQSQWHPCPYLFWDDPSRFKWSKHQHREQQRSHQEEMAEAPTSLEFQSQQGGAREDHRSPGKRKSDGEPVSTETPKRRKNDHHREAPTKPRRKMGAWGCDSEFDLWDEAILGGYY